MEHNGISNQSHSLKHRLHVRSHTAMISDSDDDDRLHEQKDLFQKRFGTTTRRSNDYIHVSKTPENIRSKVEASSRQYKENSYAAFAIASPLHNRLTLQAMKDAGYCFEAMAMQSRTNQVMQRDWPQQVKHWPTNTNLAKILDSEQAMSFLSNKELKCEYNFKHFGTRVSACD